MTLPRGLLIAVLIAIVAITTIGVRQDMAACSHEIQLLHQRRTRMEQELWSRQMELARLRLPENMRRRIDDMSVDIHLPKIIRRASTQKVQPNTHD